MSSADNNAAGELHAGAERRSRFHEWFATGSCFASFGFGFGEEGHPHQLPLSATAPSRSCEFSEHRICECTYYVGAHVGGRRLVVASVIALKCAWCAPEHTIRHVDCLNLPELILGMLVAQAPASRELDGLFH